MSCLGFSRSPSLHTESRVFLSCSTEVVILKPLFCSWKFFSTLHDFFFKASFHLTWIFTPSPPTGQLLWHCCWKFLENKSSGMQCLVSTEDPYFNGKKEFSSDEKLLWKVATDDQRTHTETLGIEPVKVDYLSSENQWIIKNYIFRAGGNFKIYSAGVQSLKGKAERTK